MMEDFAHINAIALGLIKDWDNLFSVVDYSPYYKCYIRALFEYQPPDDSSGEVRNCQHICIGTATN